MAKNIPFFDMFAELQLSGALRLKLAGAELTGAAIDQSALSISMSLTVRTAMSGEDLEDLKQMIQAVYGFRRVDIDLTCKLPDTARASVPQAVATGGGGKESDGAAVEKVLLGKPIKAKPVPMKTLDLKMGSATVSGKVFSAECTETRRPGMWRLTFEMTDYTNSVTVHKNLTAKEAE